MKRLLIIIKTLLTILSLPVMLFAQQQNDNGTSGYSTGATMGLVVIIVLAVIGIAGFTWRKKEKGKENPPT